MGERGMGGERDRGREGDEDEEVGEGRVQEGGS